MADAVIPIVQRAYDVAVALYRYVNRFPRMHKPLLGRELMGLALRLIVTLVTANRRRDKGPELLRLREELEKLKVLLRLCHDVKPLPNPNRFEYLKPITCCYFVIASDQRERGNLAYLTCVTVRLLRPLRLAQGPRNDTPANAFALTRRCPTNGCSAHSSCAGRRQKRPPQTGGLGSACSGCC